LVYARLARRDHRHDGEAGVLEAARQTTRSHDHYASRGRDSALLEGRIGPSWDLLGTRTSDEDYTILLKELKRRPIDYFRDFYADTATFGARGTLVCALDFFGVENMLFASDAPFDPERGPMFIRETIKIIDGLEISDADKQRLYRDNAVELLALDWKH
jgi:aminocarboxymuconate-semialdehyde decarboxylase